MDRGLVTCGLPLVRSRGAPVLGRRAAKRHSERLTKRPPFRQRLLSPARSARCETRNSQIAAESSAIAARRVVGMSDESHEPDEPLRIVQPDAYYRRLARRGDRRDRGLITLFVVITVIFFGGLVVWMFLRGGRFTTRRGSMARHPGVIWVCHVHSSQSTSVAPRSRSPACSS
jgi:hypothetical protein